MLLSLFLYRIAPGRHPTKQAAPDGDPAFASQRAGEQGHVPLTGKHFFHIIAVNDLGLVHLVDIYSAGQVDEPDDIIADQLPDPAEVPGIVVGGDQQIPAFRRSLIPAGGLFQSLLAQFLPHRQFHPQRRDLQDSDVSLPINDQGCLLLCRIDFHGLCRLRHAGYRLFQSRQATGGAQLRQHLFRLFLRCLIRIQVIPGEPCPQQDAQCSCQHAEPSGSFVFHACSYPYTATPHKALLRGVLMHYDRFFRVIRQPSANSPNPPSTSRGMGHQSCPVWGSLPVLLEPVFRLVVTTVVLPVLVIVNASLYVLPDLTCC